MVFALKLDGRTKATHILGGTKGEPCESPVSQDSMQSLWQAPPDNLPSSLFAYGRSISDPVHHTLQMGPKNEAKTPSKLFSPKLQIHVPLNSSRIPKNGLAGDEDWRQLPRIVNGNSTMEGRRVHPIVAALKSMRRRGTENMIVSMALAERQAKKEAGREEQVSRMPSVL